MLISYAKYMQERLYGANGYYASDRARVGKTRQNDFSTSSSFELYGQLVLASLETLLGLHPQPSKPTLVEIGCERGAGIFSKLSLNPEIWAGLREFVLGEPLDLEGPCVIFSNELLDAFAADRLRFSHGIWTQLGLDPAEGLLDASMGAAPAPYTPYLPAEAPEGTIVELSELALAYLDELARMPWQGLFVAADYGFSWLEALERPDGTLRVYHSQQQLSLKEAWTQKLDCFDMTAHVNWDAIAHRLKLSGMQPQRPLSQESFLVGYAGRVFPTLNAQERGQLKQLVHPSMMGQAFQMLIASKA